MIFNFIFSIIFCITLKCSDNQQESGIKRIFSKKELSEILNKEKILIPEISDLIAQYYPNYEIIDTLKFTADNNYSTDIFFRSGNELEFEGGLYNADSKTFWSFNHGLNLNTRRFVLDFDFIQNHHLEKLNISRRDLFVDVQIYINDRTGPYVIFYSFKQKFIKIVSRDFFKDSLPGKNKDKLVLIEINGGRLFDDIIGSEYKLKLKNEDWGFAISSGFTYFAVLKTFPFRKVELVILKLYL